ncbi:MAG TPA: OmpA family protein [Devosiaceae bacterium]|nr:OmpA family protein [Devosiaceae bacterium]
MFARLVVASFAVLLLAGCATLPNPFGGPAEASQPASTSVPPPVASAPSPQVTGAATSSDPRVASLLAAGDVPLKHAAIAGYMDQEEADLRAQLGSSGASVTRAGDQLIVTLPGFLTFEDGKSAVKPQFAPTLAKIGGLVKKYDKTVVDVYGYSDNSGTEQQGRDISQRRAVSVATALANQGVDQRRFYIEGRGSANPVASDANEVGRAKNRRVEIQISPLSAG